MPLLEVVQTKQLSASIRLTDTTATQVDQYAAFIHACADDVVEQALTYVFLKDRDFQEFLKTPEARRVVSTLRIRKVPAVEQAEIGCKKARSRSDIARAKGGRGGGFESMIPPWIQWQDRNGAAHRITVDTPPLVGSRRNHVLQATTCH